MALALRRLQADILARASAAPAPGALALIVAGQVCGSLQPATAALLAQRVSGLRLGDGKLELCESGPDPSRRSEHLQCAARLLFERGLVGAWRDENLEIRAHPDGPALAWIDRCAVRVLGITTYSVHLNGYTADGRLVVGRRAAHKRVDPGLWDNLAGGMIAAGEDVRSALAREALEEAGIPLNTLQPQEGARIAVRRSIAEGILAEVVHVFDLELPMGMPVINQDGEVECFETRRIEEVVAAIGRGEFTIEAALATLDSLLRRGWN